MVAFIINLVVVATFANQFYDETCATTSTLSACLGPGSVVILFCNMLSFAFTLRTETDPNDNNTNHPG